MIDTITKIYDTLTNKFSNYRITYVDSNIVKSVPLDPANTDYIAIQKWIADGNTVIDNPPQENN
jgi:hypothetical protein